MTILFYILRQFVLFDLNIALDFFNYNYDFVITKELLSSMACISIRLILKGVIEDSFNEMPAPGITTLGADLFKGSYEAASGQASGSGEASGSGQASGSGEAYGSSEGGAYGTDEAGSGENSDYDEDKENSDSDPSPHGDAINGLIYNDDKVLIGQPKKTLDDVRERLKLMKDSYIKHPVPASEGQIKFVDRKDKICQEELAKRESEEE
jgi:hypothetical protein